MLTPYDIQMMEETVRGLVKDWNTNVDIRKPLPIEEQTNWNAYMHEYSGPIQYRLHKDVSAERRDVQNTTIYDQDIRDSAGDRGDGRLIFSFSDLEDFIDENCRLLYNGEMWRVTFIKKRIGEIIVIIDKVTGTDEVWELVEDTEPVEP